jgi:hypothetical protein
MKFFKDPAHLRALFLYLLASAAICAVCFYNTPEWAIVAVIICATFTILRLLGDVVHDARVRAVNRRLEAALRGERKLTVGKTTLFYDGFSARVGDSVMELPQKEFLLLFKLLSYPGKIFTRRQLMDEIWDMDSESDERTVDVHVSRLRDRFRDCSDFEILTVRGLGYKAVIIK